MLWVKLPLIAVIVSGKLPVGVEPLVLIVNCELPDRLMEAGLKAAVVPAGNPFTLSSAIAENPFCAVTVAVKVVEDPGWTDWLDGLTASVKSAAALITSVRFALWVKAPLVAVMVKG